jgi:SAM-dependent methyltransferase
MDWRAANRANWDERVAVHLASPAYDLSALRRGDAQLHPIEQRELGPVGGLKILHLQCHFGRDTLTLAQEGAELVGLDFSAPAISAARELADELGLADRARFVEADVYDALEVIDGHGTFDRVFVTWGTICWIPDVSRWAEIVAAFLKPGGYLYFAEAHPAALIFDDRLASPYGGPAGVGGMPGWFAPYFTTGPSRIDDPSDYASDTAQLENSVTYDWNHSISTVVNALIGAGLQLTWLHEHDSVPWQMFTALEPADGGMFRWPENPWLPLAYSLRAGKAST